MRLYDELSNALAELPEDQRRTIEDNPGTTARVVGDKVEFTAGGIVYLTLDREWFGPEVEWLEFIAAHIEDDDQ